MPEPVWLAGRGVDQVGILVEDLELALGAYTRLWPDGQWSCYEHGPKTIPRMTYRGRPATYSFRAAFGEQVPQIELIQPVGGPSHFHEWLEDRGAGVHHFGFLVPSLADVVADMEARGIGVIQSGSDFGLDGDGSFAYFDTTEALGVLVEAIQRPSRRPEPDFVWPEPREDA